MLQPSSGRCPSCARPGPTSPARMLGAGAAARVRAQLGLARMAGGPIRAAGDGDRRRRPVRARAVRAAGGAVRPGRPRPLVGGARPGRQADSGLPGLCGTALRVPCRARRRAARDVCGALRARRRGRGRALAARRGQQPRRLARDHRRIVGARRAHPRPTAGPAEAVGRCAAPRGAVLRAAVRRRRGGARAGRPARRMPGGARGLGRALCWSPLVNIGPSISSSSLAWMWTMPSGSMPRRLRS